VSNKVRMILLSLFGIAAATTAGAATWSALAHYGVARPPVSAPEIDVLSASSALTFLSGALLVWRGRRARK
jgi:hypothetical protein